MIGPGRGAISFHEDDFGPAALSDTVLWLRADSGITLNGSTVSQWNDKSSSGYNVAQATASAQPTFLASDADFNHRPSLSFAAANGQRLTNAGALVSQPNTIYLAGKISDFTFSNPGFFDASTTRQIMAAFSSSSQQWEMYAGTLVLGGTADFNPHILCCVFNGASSAFYVDNSQTPAFTGNAGTNALSGLLLGGTTSEFLEGKIAEMVVGNTTHSAVTRSRLMAYMGGRYNIAVS